MGNLVWHDWARYVSITASVYAMWSAFWGFFFRKFFWDFVGGTIRDPGGIEPSKAAAPFVAVIVTIPLVQAAAMVVGFLILLLELPPPFLKSTALYRSFVPRIVLLLFQSFLTVLYYQGTNASIWSLFALWGYVTAQMKGEVMEEVKANRGGGSGGGQKAAA